MSAMQSGCPFAKLTLHYYSNFVGILWFADGENRYVKFKLRPYDESISEDSGNVEPTGFSHQKQV